MPVVQSQGQVISMDTTDPRLGAAFGGGISLVGGQFQSLGFQQAYREQLWVHACVNKLSRGVSRLPLKSYRGHGKARERLRREDHPLPASIERPYPGGNMFTLLNAATTEYLIEGLVLIAKLRPSPSSPPDQLVPLDWSQVQTWRGDDGRVLFYEWRATPMAAPYRLLPSDVIRLGFAKGASPLRALQHSLMVEDAAQRSTRAFYENGTQLSGVFTTDRKLDENATRTVESQIRSDHAGADNHFRVAVLSNVPGAKWQPFGVASKDAETVSHRKLSREEVCAAYDVPPPLVAILDNASFSNINTQTRMWVVDTLAVHTTMIEMAFISQLVDGEPAYADCWVEFDMGELLRGTPMEQAEAISKQINSGVLTPNEGRDLLNRIRSEDPWADGLYIPSNLAAIDTPGPLNVGTSSGGGGTGSGSSSAAQNP